MAIPVGEKEIVPGAYIRRVLLGLIQVQVICVLQAYSERPYASFGSVSGVAVDFIPKDICILPTRPLIQLTVSARNKPVLHFFSFSRDGVLSLQSAITVTAPARSMKVLDLTAGRTPDIVLLHEHTLSILSIGALENQPRIVSFPGSGDDFTAADINGDGHPDFLLYGKNSAGIATMIGRAGKSFVEGPLLFPDISVSDLVCKDLNGDGITDIILCNWLSNQLVVFLGIGRAVFSEQITIDLPGEPENMSLVSLPKKREFRIAVSVPDQREIIIYDGDALGDFQQRVVIHVPDAPHGVRLIDTNGDNLFDVVTSTKGGIVVSLAMSGSHYSEPVLYGATINPSSWDVGDIDGDKLPDLVVGEASMKKIVALGNTKHAASIRWPDNYSVGNNPTGIATRDFDGDGLIDIAVANTRSESVSILYNAGGGRLRGQDVIPVGKEPLFLRTASVERGAEKTLVISHSHVDQATVLHLNQDSAEARSSLVPTDNNPYVVFAKDVSAGGQLEMLVRSTKQRSVSLSLFQQLGGSEFLERSVRSIPSANIIALTVGDLTKNGSYDLVVASMENSSKSVVVSVAEGDSSFTFRPAQSVFSYSDSTRSTVALLSGFVTSHEFKDIVVVKGKPEYQIGIASGFSFLTYHDSLIWIDHVNPLHEDAIIFKDVDFDNITDIVLPDASQKMVMVYYGKKGGGFENGSSVFEADDIQSIRIAPIKSPPALDLIVSRGERGMVSLVPQPFRRTGK